MVCAQIIVLFHGDVGLLCSRHLSAAPFDKDLVCSCYGVVEEGRYQVHSSLYRIGTDEGPLQLLTTLKSDGGNCRWYGLHLVCCWPCAFINAIHSSVWHPASLPQLATVSESHLTLWNVGQGEIEVLWRLICAV